MKLIRRKKQQKENPTSNADMQTNYVEREVFSDLDKNEQYVKDIFNHPKNHALEFRKVYIAAIHKYGLVIYEKAAVTIPTIEKHIIEPLVRYTNESSNHRVQNADFVLTHVLTTTNGRTTNDLEKITEELINGNTVVFIEGCNDAITIETSGFESRPVEKPTMENYVKGPKEAFVESMYYNLSLIRKQIRDPRLTCEVVSIGDRAPQKVSILYIDNLADSEIVAQVKEKLSNIKSDTVLNLNILEQYIEDRPYSLVTSTLTTERPDRACSFLLEGHVALLMDNSPNALIVPVTFWTLFHTGEDHYLRLPNGNFIRVIRFIAMFIALYAPAVYIAISTFHTEMLPTDLILAIAANRERVPFPSIVELIFMELSFEILREAGIRIPNVIGPTIGIVGALILGQAAVDANIISPIMVIVVAITGLSSFVVPEISFNYTVRFARFILLFAAALIGFFGIGLVTTFFIAYLCSIKSFGVPFFSPFSPSMPSSNDLIMRPPIWKQWLRPSNLSPQDQQRMKENKGSRS